MSPQQPDLSVQPRLELDLAALGAASDGSAACTAILQTALDRCAAAGGGIVRLPPGRYRSGAVQLRDGVVLELAAGAVLCGSQDHRDYGEGRWTDALLTGIGISRFALRGPGRIDGMDCQRPDGEEGFRGPHSVRLVDCSDFVIRDLGIERAGNYAVRFDRCERAECSGLRIRGGHDGLHPQACSDFEIRDCDLRTGDDCIAGCDNQRFRFSDCAFNSSCNGFRFGCDQLLVERCRFWGPGEHAHQISRRTNMLAAFVHFAPSDREPQLPSDRWTIREITVEHADAFYLYDSERGLWQTGQPALHLAFERVRASGLRQPITVLGDPGQRFELRLEDAELALDPAHAAQPLLDLRRFGRLLLHSVRLHNDGSAPVLRCREGGEAELREAVALPERAGAFELA